MCSSDVPSAYVVPGTENNPLGAAPLLTGTKPASVSRFSMLHGRQSPSDTHDGAALAGGTATGAAAVDVESVRGAAGGGATAGCAESARDPSERPQAITSSATAHNA